jgi:membrane-associated protein
MIQNYGIFVYAIMFVVVFVETGFVVMPFLPGDSLLFVAGTFAAVGSLNVIWLFLLLSFAAIIGDTVNYWVGKYFGEKVFSKFIKKEHLDKTKSFYDKYGKKTIIIARFIPIVRTLAPFVAGVGKMHYSTFLIYNIIGGISWVLIFVFAGYSFGTIPAVKENLSLIILGIIILSIIPAIVEYFRGKQD